MKCTDTFRTLPYRHNCAQAVAYKYCKALGMTQEQAVEHFAASATGRAPGGLCGALHVCLCAHPDKADAIREQFAAKTGGYLTCADIKGLSQTPCPVCVDVADSIMEDLEKE